MSDDRELKIRITGDSKGFVGPVQAAGDAVENLGNTTRTQTQGAQSGVRGLSNEFLQLQDTLDPSVANTRRLAAATDLLDRELKQGNITVERHAQLLAMANQRYAQTHGSFRLMRGSVQQLGFQVQDMAVQMQMGVNPIVALTQQGSQLASIMGPGGALMGAVLAIGGAIAGTLVGSLRQASDEVEDFKDRVDGLLGDTVTFQIYKTERELEAEKAKLEGLAQAFQDAADARDKVLTPPNQRQRAFLGDDLFPEWQPDPEKLDAANKKLAEARVEYLGTGESIGMLTNRLNELLDKQAGRDNTGRAAAAQGRALQALVDDLLPVEARTREYRESVATLNAAIDQFPGKADLYRRALDALHARHGATAVSVGDLGVAIEGFNGLLTDNLDLSSAYLQASADDYYDRMEKAHQQHQDRIAVSTQVTAYAFENAWVSALKAGEDLWKSFADTVIDQILRIQYQMFIGEGMENIFRGMFSGIFPGPTPITSGASDFGGIDLTLPGSGPGSVPGLGTIDLSLGRPTASRPDSGASVVINQVNDFSNVSTADEARIRQMLDENSRQTEARIYQHINRGGAAARTVGRR